VRIRRSFSADPRCRRCRTAFNSEPAKVRRVARSEYRIGTERRSGDHAIEERSPAAATRIVHLRSEDRVHGIEGLRLTDHLGDIFDHRHSHRAAQELRPRDRRDAHRFVPTQPGPKPPLLDGARHECADEIAGVEVNHTRLSAPARAGGAALGAGMTRPCRRRRGGETGGTLSAAERGERCLVVQDTLCGRRSANDPAQRLRFRDVPSTCQPLERRNRLGVEGVGRLDARYGHDGHGSAIPAAGQ
jgi:hypothetical protein